jgi:hypothetical protein
MFSMLFNSLTSKEEKNAISYIQGALFKNSSYLLVNNFEMMNDLTCLVMKLSLKINNEYENIIY